MNASFISQIPLLFLARGSKITKAIDDFMQKAAAEERENVIGRKNDYRIKARRPF